MKLLFLVVALPVFGAIVFVLAANRDMVQVDFWPFWQSLAMPLWVAAYGAFCVGFLLGIFATWAALRGSRVRARTEARRAERLARDNAALEARLAQAQAAQSGQGRPLAARP
jgi:uncharacterized integral membrane protein